MTRTTITTTIGNDITAAVLFLAAAAFFFSPIVLPHKICIGLLLLTLFSIGRNPWMITAALFFSFLGDLAGSYQYGSASMLPFIFQMGGFAVAHIFFICWFLGQRKDESCRTIALKAALPLAVLISALLVVAPCVQPPVIRIGVSLYAGVISIMLFSTLRTRDIAFIVGALLFVFSDYTLAVNKFVTHVPASEYMIMVPYYGAQLIFFLFTKKGRTIR